MEGPGGRGNAEETPFPPVSAVSVLSVSVGFVPVLLRQDPGKPGHVVSFA